MKTVSYELDILATEVLSLAEAAGLDKIHFYNSGEKTFVLPLIVPELERFANLVLARNKSKPQPDADGWIKWNGGECPVDAGTLVDCKLRDGAIEGCQKAFFFDWSDLDYDTDIIAYRIVNGD